MQQTMTRIQAEGEYRSIALDVTKTWSQSKFPLRPIGKFILNRNPVNYFDEIEQVGYFILDYHDGTDGTPARFHTGPLDPLH